MGPEAFPLLIGRCFRVDGHSSVSKCGHFLALEFGVARQPAVFSTRSRQGNLARQMLISQGGEHHLWKKLLGPTIIPSSAPSRGFTKALPKFRHTARLVICFHSNWKNRCD